MLAARVPTSASSAGSSTRRPSSRRACGNLARGREPHGLLPAGYRAIDSLRLEKGYRAWGADITPDDSPLEAGLGFAVAFDKEVRLHRAGRGAAAPRRGRDAATPMPDAHGHSLLHPRERTRASGDEIVARITSGGIGYAVGKSIAFAYLPTGLADEGTSCRSRSSANGWTPRSSTTRSGNHPAKGSGRDGVSTIRPRRTGSPRDGREPRHRSGPRPGPRHGGREGRRRRPLRRRRREGGHGGSGDRRRRPRSSSTSPIGLRSSGPSRRRTSGSADSTSS